LSGWREDVADGLDLPDEEFNYEEFVKKEFEDKPADGGLSGVWWAAAVAALLGLIAVLFRGF
jgi:hypothetical protein